MGSEADKQALVQDETSPFFTTPHFNGHLSVLLRGSRIGELSRDELAEVVQDAWLARASPRRAAEWLPRAPAALTRPECCVASGPRRVSRRDSGCRLAPTTVLASSSDARVSAEIGVAGGRRARNHTAVGPRRALDPADSRRPATRAAADPGVTARAPPATMEG